jgi:hypothetical protein
MTYTWPRTAHDPVLDEALDVALNLLVASGDTAGATERVAAEAIFREWESGVRQKEALANSGVVAVQNARTTPPALSVDLPSVFPNVA